MPGFKSRIPRLKALMLQKKKEKQDGVDYFSVLPNEILENIFAHLRPKFLFKNVLPVCRRFYYVVNNKRWWRLRIGKYPPLTHLHGVDMLDSSPLRYLDAIWREEEAWSNWEHQKRHVTMSYVGKIEAVRLFRKSSSRFFISAASKESNWTSDRCGRVLQVWSLDNRNDNNGLLCETIGHTNTVPSITMGDRDQFISGSWDKSIKLWNIDNSSVREIASFQGEHLNKQVAYENGLLASCSVLGTLSIHDPYNGLQELSRLTYRCPINHIKLARAIVFKSPLVYMACWDELFVVDIRKLNTPVQRREYDQALEPGSEFEVTMDWHDGLLQCCNHRGMVQMYEPSTLRLSYSFPTCNQDEYKQYRANKLVRNRGSLLVQTGKVVKAFSLRQGHAHLGTFNQFPDNQYPTTMDARDGNVVVGCSRGSLITWTVDD